MLLSSDISNKVFRHISEGPFKNRHGVVFEAEDYKSLSACKRIAFIPEIAQLDIEFFAEKKTFSRALDITTIRDLYSIDQAFLEALYLLGQAEYVCEVHLAYTQLLVFKLVEGKMIAYDDLRAKHQVQVELKETTDFINYTTNYYKSLSLKD